MSQPTIFFLPGNVGFPQFIRTEIHSSCNHCSFIDPKNIQWSKSGTKSIQNNTNKAKWTSITWSFIFKSGIHNILSNFGFFLFMAFVPFLGKVDVMHPQVYTQRYGSQSSLKNLQRKRKYMKIWWRNVIVNNNICISCWSPCLIPSWLHHLSFP